MTPLVADPSITRPIVSWLEIRMAAATPLAAGGVRLVGVVVIDPTFTDADTAARASWIADGDSVSELLAVHAGELPRYDAIAAAIWPGDRGSADGPHVSLLIVNP